VASAPGELPLARLEAFSDAVFAIAVTLPSMLLYGVGIEISLLFPTVGVISYLASAIARGLPTDAARRALGRA
jgi:hypothetical protein